ncbi:Lrp/AsnC family transcriptional regulator [Actinosynnema mirum]|uniref:Transcriptional regulator, AsnC family n=1 Tax=Actinosynnema mirum (strain ATCC 29888 / DSM 43827 / JCM 3225 / NBRC 14064 / NCIMB 13271 / NRRL B-12336 / IMRU 3971 / 101) TaxID=446462 RepID=C6WFA4_ACTMD|nr:Lrp/AsnC family transcriptional regulator [Actinosynnema mirum]ACU34236.1 transcriptional regulator, AsnC family [Actinosynnema mirum DSM 43827]AXX27607.1 Transcriptional regulator, AsnC family [Actinosynnema pretiosum subsp. pretiosum]
MRTDLDAVDWALVDALQADARLSYNELARKVGVSPPTVAQRVRRLENAGVITGYRAVVDPTAVGRSVIALVRMKCYGPRCITVHPELLDDCPEVVEVVRLTGDICSVVKVVTTSVSELERLLVRLGGHGETSSAMVLSTPIPWRPLTAG